MTELTPLDTAHDAMQAAPEDAMDFHRVDRRVNSNRASGPELIEPIDA